MNPSRNPPAVIALREKVAVVRAQLRPIDCGVHYCRYCTAGTANNWRHGEHCPYEISVQEVERARRALDDLDAIVTRVEPPELPDWMPSASELLQHMTRYRALRAAVDTLDPAAADNQPYGEWDAAKWAVFNAAVRLVKETAPDIGATTRVEPPPQEQDHSNYVGPMVRDDDIPPEVRRDLMACAVHNGRISYGWLCGVFRKGRDHEAMLAHLAAPLSPPTQEP